MRKRIIAKMLGCNLETVDAYGDTQWAYKTVRSRQDMIAVLISRRLLALNSEKKIGLYLSDISGAFDRVGVRLLLQRAPRAGLSLIWLRFLSSYLAPRFAVVVVDGAHSEPYVIRDMVFQGTVLGPIL